MTKKLKTSPPSKLEPVTVGLQTRRATEYATVLHSFCAALMNVINVTSHHITASSHYDTSNRIALDYIS